MQKTRKNRRGFSLIELAIVFGIIGVILGGLWATVGPANEKSLRQKLAEEITTVVNNIHSFGASVAGIDNSDRTISRLVPILVKRNIFPPQMVRQGLPCTNNSAAAGPPERLCADTPWGPTGSLNRGTFGVCAWIPWTAAGADTICPNGPGGPATFQNFAIELKSLTLDNCINIVPQNSGAAGPSGLIDVVINGTSIMDPANIGITHSLPVQVTDATALCAADSTVDFVYRLRAPNF